MCTIVHIEPPPCVFSVSLASRIYEGGAQCAHLAEGVLLQSKIKDFCQPPHKCGGQVFLTKGHYPRQVDFIIMG